MVSKTLAIVLGAVKYGDNSIILKTYTKEFGLLSFIAGSVRNKKGPVKPSMVQVLSQLEILFYHKSKSPLKRIKEASVAKPYEHIFYEPIKSCIGLFLAEMLQHALHEEEKNLALYGFIEKALYTLDESEDNTANFHLVFLYQLSDYLGFKPEYKSDFNYFDLMSGVYEKTEPLHGHYIEGNTLNAWKELDDFVRGEKENTQWGNATRAALLTAILDYYRLHIKDFGQLKSLAVLHEILH